MPARDVLQAPIEALLEEAIRFRALHLVDLLAQIRQFRNQLFPRFCLSQTTLPCFAITVFAGRFNTILRVCQTIPPRPKTLPESPARGNSGPLQILAPGLHALHLRPFRAHQTVSDGYFHSCLSYRSFIV